MDISADQIAFLVTFLVTSAVVIGVHLILSPNTPSPRQKRRVGYVIVVSALVVFVLSVLDVFGLRLLSGDLDTRAGLFSVLLAMMSSLAAVYLVKTGSAAANQLVSAGLFVIVLLTFFLGLFWSYLPIWFGSVSEASFEAASITFSFKSSREAPSGVMNINADKATKTGISVFERDTDYQFGAETLQFLVQAAPRDIDRMKSLGIACQPAGDQPGCTCDKPESPDQADRLGCLFASLDQMKLYFEKIDPFANCLVSYAGMFPNGLPMHQALAEIALYLSSRPWAAPTSMSSMHVAASGGEGSGTYAKQIFEKLRLIGQLSATASEAASEECQFEPPYWSDLMAMADEWAKTFKPPHRTLFEASIIVSAGYPHDAALYIERQLDEQLAYLDTLAEGPPERQRDAALIRTMFELRTLAILDQLYAHLDEAPRNAELLQRFRGAFRNLIKLLLDKPTDKPTEWLAACAERKYDGTYLGNLMAINADFERYFVASIYSALVVEARFVEVSKFTDIFRSMDFDALDETAAELKTIAMQDGNFQDCFSPWVDSYDDEGSRQQLRMRLFEAYVALSLASIELQGYLITGHDTERHAIDETIDRDELRQRLCTSRSVAIAVNANRRNHELGTQEGKIVDALRSALAPIQATIERNGISC